MNAYDHTTEQKKITYHFYARAYSMATTNKRMVSVMTTAQTQTFTNIYDQATH